jgi:hypothetical protein
MWLMRFCLISLIVFGARQQFLVILLAVCFLVPLADLTLEFCSQTKLAIPVYFNDPAHE